MLEASQIILKAYKQDQTLQVMHELKRLQCCVGIKNGVKPKQMFYLDSSTTETLTAYCNEHKLQLYPDCVCSALLCN